MNSTLFCRVCDNQTFSSSNAVDNCSRNQQINIPRFEILVITHNWIIYIYITVLLDDFRYIYNTYLWTRVWNEQENPNYLFYRNSTTFWKYTILLTIIVTRTLCSFDLYPGESLIYRKAYIRSKCPWPNRWHLTAQSNNDGWKKNCSFLLVNILFSCSTV